MELTQNMQNTLNDLAEKKARVVVKGKNALGQPFETEGFIMPQVCDKCKYISKRAFGLFLGQYFEKIEGLDHELKKYLSIYSDTPNIFYSDIVYFETISLKDNGAIILRNSDFKNIISKSMEVNRDKVDYNKECEHLYKFIGKPVIYKSKNESFAIKGISVLKTGRLVADASDGNFAYGLPNTDFQLDNEAYVNLDEYEDINTFNI